LGATQAEKARLTLAAIHLPGFGFLFTDKL